MTFVVYWIREQSHTDPATQGYIGVSGNVQRRFERHRLCENGTNAYLRHAIEKYGWDNLVRSILLEADKQCCLDFETKMRPTEKIGWNLAPGGGFPPTHYGPQPKLKGRKCWNKGLTNIFSPETLEVMRKKKLAVSPANKGVPLSQERIEALRQINLGNTRRRGAKMPREVVERTAEKLRGRVQSPEERAMRSRAQKGVRRPPLSEAHKKLVSALAKGKHWYNDGTKSIFCHAENRPEGFMAGRITPWMGNKEARN